MDITYLGHASFKIRGKAATVVTDPYKGDIGMKFPKVEADIVTVSHEHFDHNDPGAVGGEAYVVAGPGEYEVKGVEIVGVASFHDDKNGAERGKNTIYNLKIDNVNICHLGDLGQTSLTDAQLGEIGNVDILLLPVGGFYTIDASVASKIASSLEPKVIIPMHYRDADNKVSELEGVEKFLKEIGKEGVTPVNKFTITAEKLPEEALVVVMEKSK